jgi:hypothetical protein
VKLTMLALILMLIVPGIAQAQVNFARASDGNGWSNKDERQAVRLVVSEWHVPGGAPRAVSVIRCESGFQARARNACCSGLLQLHRSYFPGWFRRFNPHRGWKLHRSVYNPRTNLVIGLRLAHAGGWGPWACA